MNPTPAPSSVNVHATLGMVFLGACTSSMLYGVTCLQTFHYYRSLRSKDDRTALRVLVAFLFAVDTFHQALVIHSGYTYLIINFDDVSALFTYNVWSVPAEIFGFTSAIMNSFVAMLPAGLHITHQCMSRFLIARLYRLSHHRILTASVCAAATCVLIITFSCLFFTFPSTFAGLFALREYVIAGLASSAATDMLIGFALCFYLQKSRTGLHRSNDMITKLIVISMGTGLLTVIFDLGVLITFVAATNGLYDLLLSFMLGKLYVNVVLTTLNLRKYVRHSTEDGNIHNSEHDYGRHFGIDQSREVALRSVRQWVLTNRYSA
ncbi:uncharacterized protein BXZ73DRAFT_101081 [Epithele typhae]|uniref:uncharacterized protein n=1 Tax=Epithele typhae TaxID=378194 RepID=UPI0020087B60|nr:uncharacterized protein BXZ73DRAFT_101081 [Epithele typhae]KAH9933112.1 hypothetical protein BXZ73DRAFT_101081 [Epithele typhae]